MEVKVRVFNMKTFTGKDKFINNKPKFYSADSKIKKEITDSISYFLNDFNLEYANIIGNPNNINEDSNSLNIVLGLSDGKVYLLKKILNKNIHAQSINQITELMNWCRSSGITIPKLYPTKNGEYFIIRQDSFWILMEYIDGMFFSGKYNQLNETALACGKLLRVLSDLPKQLRPLKFKDPYFTAHENEIFSKLKKTQPKWKKIFGERFSYRLSSNWDYLADQWKYINSHSFITDKYNSVIHHDLHPHNFIFSENKTYIIDYESIVIGSLQSAIGFAIIKLMKHICDTSSKKNTNNEISGLSHEWISSVGNTFPLLAKENEIEIFGRAEVFRRFLSMSNKAILNIPSSFNGPEVHLDSLFIADRIFKK